MSGKYNIFVEGQEFTEMDTMLLEQAKVNELAEANRLKRIELRLECKKYDLPTTEKELDDQAGSIS